MAELAAPAEASGSDGLLLEHYIVYQGQLGTPTYDPWIVLAAMALATTHVRLGTFNSLACCSCQVRSAALAKACHSPQP
jgi:alkanesulfonate monooxygenase SsuD/methylene tetrahydromethanopterin reductase-like flavin-dependent oxidoreductase (luciferase family)